MTNILFQPPFERAFGTYPLQGDELTAALGHALEIGYRAIDTAQNYGNEADVGRSLRALGVARDELCIITKVRPENFGEDRFMPSVRESLDKLRVEQVDLLLLHTPPMDGDVRPSLRLLEGAAKAGLARHIGVSNYNSAMMNTARETITTPLVTNQVEFHPLLDQRKLLFAATKTGIPLSSYCSVARGEVFKYPLFEQIGEGCGKTAAQIVLRWILQKGVPVNTMSRNPQNMRANFDIMHFTLSSVDMDRIEELTARNYRIVDKSRNPFVPDWD